MTVPSVVTILDKHLTKSLFLGNFNFTKKINPFPVFFKEFEHKYFCRTVFFCKKKPLAVTTFAGTSPDLRST